MNPSNYGYEVLTTEKEIKQELILVEKEYKRLNRLSKNTRIIEDKVIIESKATSYYVRIKTLKSMLSTINEGI